jgi:hypothetical protein
MATVRLIPKEEAQQTRMQKAPGVRRLRMSQFDMYASALLENRGEAVVYEEIDEEPQKFVLSLRGAFKRAGMDVSVRKMRGRNEVRAWVNEPKPAPTKRAGRTRKA